MKKILYSRGGGDCPGLNAVIRGITKRASTETGWRIYGSIEAFNGVFSQPQQIVELDRGLAAGIHVKGGTILRTTNKNSPLRYPMEQPDGSLAFVDRGDELVQIIRDMGFYAVINIGGDGSQRISKSLFEKGMPVIGVPKTIDNDLSATDVTFGFQTAVQIATDAFDKLVTTAESHNRVMIMEVMGRDAGWIALHTAISGGAEVCLIPEIPYDPRKVAERIEKRYDKGIGFVNVVISEGAKPRDGGVTAGQGERGSEHVRLGGVAYQLSQQLKDLGMKHEIRETVLGHVQRGGTPIAYDRVLATLFGIKAFELAAEGAFGRMVSFKHNAVTSVSLEEATREMGFVNPESYLVKAAKGMGISFGD
ncbi:MAG: ATP-dependent 6-phosphofructokinase [Cytophagales bacterium]|nr:ATP-dependent 6-phosphofructokinase [Cytophagales bacterium]